MTKNQRHPMKSARTKIMDAAKKMCVSGKYLSCTVEDLLIESKVSRATFYNNFSGKENLVLELVEEHVDWYIRHFRIVKKKTFSSKNDIVSWLQEVVEHYKKSGVLLAQFRVVVPTMDTLSLNHQSRMQVIEILGYKVPDLCLFNDDGSFNEKIKHKMLVWIYQMEMMMLYCAFSPKTILYPYALEDLAEEFLRICSHSE